MLVIDRIELGVIDHVADIRHFDDDDTVILQQQAKTAHDAVEVRDVRQHVIRMNDVGALVLFRELLRELRAEEFANRRYAASYGYTRDIAGRLDAEDRHA